MFESCDMKPTYLCDVRIIVLYLRYNDVEVIIEMAISTFSGVVLIKTSTRR